METTDSEAERSVGERTRQSTEEGGEASEATVSSGPEGSPSGPI